MFTADKAVDKHNLSEVDDTKTDMKKTFINREDPQDVTAVVIQMIIQKNLIPEQTNEGKTKDKTKNKDNSPNAVYSSKRGPK